MNYGFNSDNTGFPEMVLTGSFDEFTEQQELYSIKLFINLNRSIECNQKGATYIIPNVIDYVPERTIPLETDKIDIEKFITMLKCFDNNFACKTSWGKDKTKEYYITDLLYCQNYSGDSSTDIFNDVGNIYLDMNLKYGVFKLKSSGFYQTKEYFQWIHQLDQFKRYLYSSRTFTEQNNTNLYSKVLTKIDSIKGVTIPPLLRSLLVDNRSISTNYRRKYQKKDFYTQFKELPGYKFIQYSTITDYPLKIKTKSVEILAWVPPWTKTFLKYVDFNEIDATFRSTRPFSGFSFTGVIKNNGIPLVFVMAPTESLKAYTFGLLCLRKFRYHENIEAEPLTKYILADRGNSIVSFCIRNGYKHIFCWKHLLENIGNTSKMFPVIHYINDSINEEELEQRIQYARSLIGEEKYSSDRSAQKMLSLLDTTRQWTKINRLINDNGKNVAIATCSNHQESQHKTFNRHNTCYNIESRLLQIFEDMKQRVGNFISDPTRNAKNKLKKLADLAKNIPESQKRNECNCFASRYNKSLYGIDNFPCIHTIENSGMVIQPQEENGKRNYHYVIDDNQFKFDMEDLINNCIFESSTNEPWSVDNIENPKKNPINYKIKDMPNSYLCKFGESLLSPENLSNYKRFYHFTLFILSQFNFERDQANLILLNKLMNDAYEEVTKDNEFYFHLTMDIVQEANIEISEEDANAIYEKFLAFNNNN